VDALGFVVFWRREGFEEVASSFGKRATTCTDAMTPTCYDKSDDASTSSLLSI
jgi:hypothetical protein